MPHEPRQYWSNDRRFGVRIPADVVNELHRFCISSDGCETGGILIGRYSEDMRCAEVTEVSGPPEDSRRSRSWLFRGIMGLADRLRHCWDRRREYYLGDWHFHLSGDLAESLIDITAMVKISRSERTDCPEPVSLIIGLGCRESIRMSVSVFTRPGIHVELKRSDASEGCQNP